MGRSKHRTYPDDNGTDKVKSLQRKIKEQDAEIKRLKAELKTLNKAFEKTGNFIKGNLQGVSVENMIQSAREEKPLKDIEPDIDYTMYEVKKDG